KANTIEGLTISKTVRAMDRVNYLTTLPLRSPLEMGIDLVHHQHTFVLAGTGFGETRITEVYWHLFPVYRKPVLMVLNPLDTLSDNEVPEKKAAKFEAVNLTKMNISPKIEKEPFQIK
ncbi:hypothetical protein MJO29_003226, partial [Puccinia striiformis f. sp. tritici]